MDLKQPIQIDGSAIEFEQETGLRRAETAPACSGRIDTLTDVSTTQTSSSSEDEYSRLEQSNGISINIALEQSRPAPGFRAQILPHPETEASFSSTVRREVSDGANCHSSKSTSLSGASAICCFVNYVTGAESSFRESTEKRNEEVKDAYGIAPKRQGIYNLVQVPMCLERLMALGACICVDEFLFLFTLLPLRCILAILQLFRGFAYRTYVMVRESARPFSRASGRSEARLVAERYNIATVIDFLHISIFIFSSMVLAMFDISSVYHSIRGQSVIKLYVVFNVLEIFDRLCCSFGVDLLDSLGWTTANAVSYFNSKSAKDRASLPREEQSTENFSREPVRGFVLVTRVIVDCAFALVYVSIHASLLLIWVVTLNVAINTQNNALLTLLVSNNFVELKGSVFKNFKTQNVFQIACSDAVERFQLTIFLGVMLVYAEGDFRLLMTWSVIFICEVVVDWIKHAFVTKFNRISPKAYKQFSAVICTDIVQLRKNSAVRSIGGSGVAKRIGFVSLPLGALVVRMTADRVLRSPITVSFFVFLIMAATKLTASIALLGHAVRTLKPIAGRERNTVAELRSSDESATYNSLAKLGRYDKY